MKMLKRIKERIPIGYRKYVFIDEGEDLTDTAFDVVVTRTLSSAKEAVSMQPGELEFYKSYPRGENALEKTVEYLEMKDDE